MINYMTHAEAQDAAADCRGWQNVEVVKSDLPDYDDDERIYYLQTEQGILRTDGYIH